MFENLDVSPEATIKVVGVGGAGGNAINEMMRRHLQNVTFIALNTDAQALKKSEADIPVQIGQERTRGYGCGADPTEGYNAAMESEDLIRSQLEGTDMLFIACGMGGGTGTGASPVVAKIANEMGILTVGVVTKPFEFEGKKRMVAAEAGIHHLREYVDSLIVIENNNLVKKLPAGTSLMQAFTEADSVLCSAVYAIAEVITASGLINVDFADVKTVMKSTGRALMGAGEGEGENRAEIAAERAIDSPLLEDFEMKAAKGILCTITHGLDFTIDEMTAIGDKVQNLASPDATVVIGTIPNSDMEDKCVVTVIATGIDHESDTESPVSDIARNMRREPQATGVPVDKSQTQDAKVFQTSKATPATEASHVENSHSPTATIQRTPQRAPEIKAKEDSSVESDSAKEVDVQSAAPLESGKSKARNLFNVPDFLK
ncbi:cell division protein FtsZ [Alteromonas macleodii]|uniref:cell division protein FtsZ n=1 Tax=Alteromonas macleodii TaxID=28108 RepID=UPI0031406F1D|tara:strand:+ start:169602 stop:170894 length:1293 start_codon:yes stop_codon:yes gene_type:complete